VQRGEDLPCKIVRDAQAPGNSELSELQIGRRLVSVRFIQRGEVVVCQPLGARAVSGSKTEVDALCEQHGVPHDAAIYDPVTKLFVVDLNMSPYALATTMSWWYAMNHLLHGNLEMKAKRDRSRQKLLYMYWIAKHDILAGEELCFNYRDVPDSFNKPPQ
jgi:hypothetical protein